MKTYIVRVPIAGVVSYEVEADNEEAAIDKALSADFSVYIKGDDDSPSPELEEFDVYRKTLNGNVNYTPLWEAEAEEI